MFGSQYNNTKVMIDDLSNLSQMNTAVKADSEGVMKPPKGEEMDAGSWWAWLSGYTRQKTQENVARVQEELTSMGVDTTGLSPEYQQSMLEGIAQAKAYRDKFDITQSLKDKPVLLEEQGAFPQTSIDQPVGVTEEALGAGTVDISPRAEEGEPRVMGRPAEPDPDSVDTSKPEAGGIMAKPSTTVKKNSLLEFIASGEGGYDSANRGTIKQGTTDKIVGSQMVASRGGRKISELTVDEILKYQAIKDPNNKDRLFAVGKYQTDNRTFPMAVEALGLSGDTVFSPEVQEQVGLYLVSEKPGRKRLSKYLKGIGDVSADRAMLDLAMEFASIPVPFAIKKGSYANGKWPKVDLKAGDSFYASGGKGGNKAQHTVEETLKVLEENKGSVPSGNTKGVSPRPRLRDDE
jgi:hypothetical protein